MEILLIGLLVYFLVLSLVSLLAVANPPQKASGVGSWVINCIVNFTLAILIAVVVL